MIPQRKNSLTSTGTRQVFSQSHMPHVPANAITTTNANTSGQNAGYYEKRNPLIGVSTEYMREAGYAIPFTRLIRGNDEDRTHTSHAADRDPVEHKAKERKTSSAGAGSSKTSAVNKMVSPVTSGHSGAPVLPVVSTRGSRRFSTVMIMKKRKNSAQRQPHHALREKKRLMHKRVRACDYSVLSAIVGIVFIVLEAELTDAKRIDKGSLVSILLLCLAVASTCALIYLILYYHLIELKIAAIDSGTYDWRVALNLDRVLQCSVECCICAICPFPGDLWLDWAVLRIGQDGTVDPRRATSAPVCLDAVLSVPMFLRCYLLCRFMALHSRHFQDAATRSIAALNYITMNFQFVFRTMVDENPLRVMVIFSIVFCVMMAWLLTQCDRYSNLPESKHYLNALWFVFVTYISVGYGDVVPASYCARVLAVCTGIVGKIVSSVLIAVISRQMNLSRSEVHVHNFVADSKLGKERKHAAARVLQNLWFIHRCKKRLIYDESKLRHHQRQFLGAIAEFRRIKWEQRRLAEMSNSFIELSIAQKEMSDTVWTLQRSQCVLSAQVSYLAERLQELGAVICHVQQNAQVNRTLRMKLAAIDNEDTKICPKTSV